MLEHVYIRDWGNEVPASNVLVAPDDPEWECRIGEVTRFILEALRREPPQSQAAYRYYLMGFDAWAIGQVLGLSSNAVHLRVRRTQESVVAYVRERVGDGR